MSPARVRHTGRDGESPAAVLIVSSDGGLRSDLVEVVKGEGLNSMRATGRDSALPLLDGDEADVVVLDLDPHSALGADFCWEIRERTTAPLLVLANEGEEAALVRGLEIGADAFLVKPFTVGILLAQLYALLRRIGEFHTGHAGQIDSGGLRINVVRHEVTLDGERVDLTPTEYRILSCLVRNAGRAISHRSLLRQAQGYESETSEAREILKVHIHNLRSKIEPDPKSPRFIVGVRGFGYLFERRRLERGDLDKVVGP